MNEFRQYEVAINAFRLEYNALLGDMDNAFDYWQSSCGDGTEANCNGNGNGGLEDDHEEPNAWHHLSLASILPGNYAGRDADWVNNIKTSKYNPSSALQGGMFDLNFPCVITAPCAPFFQPAEHFLRIGMEVTKSDLDVGPPYEPLLSPKNAKAINMKADDGNPHTGKYRSSFAKNCLQLNGVPLANDDGITDTNFQDYADGTGYNLSDNSNLCSLYLSLGF